jgi:hypothetical protein
MLRLGLKPTNPLFERAKTVHALDRAATVTGFKFNLDMSIVCEVKR